MIHWSWLILAAVLGIVVGAIIAFFIFCIIAANSDE